jgi:hypothetical protein
VVVHKPPFEATTSPHRTVPVSAEDWPALMLRVNEPSDLPSWRSLVDICAVLPGILRIAVLDDRGASVSCAELPIEPDQVAQRDPVFQRACRIARAGVNQLRSTFRTRNPTF